MGGGVSFEDFSRIKLRVARVESCERVPKSDKLLKLEIDLGDEKRTIVAGLAEHYEPDSLKGRTIVVVANLEKARIFGIESSGMLLAADTGTDLRLVVPDGECPPGSSVK